jgi:hypothetical protein
MDALLASNQQVRVRFLPGVPKHEWIWKKQRRSSQVHESQVDLGWRVYDIQPADAGPEMYALSEVRKAGGLQDGRSVQGVRGPGLQVPAS